MGGEFGYNPERETNPEHGKDLEIEVKIINLGNPDLLINKLEAIGAELEIPKRRIKDRNYNLDENSLPELKKPIKIEIRNITNLQSLENVLKFLGFHILNKEKDFWIINRTLPPERRTVRIRLDKDKYTWTVKNPRKKNSTHDERIELNVSIAKPEDAEQILLNLGYQRKGVSEKDRVTYKLDGCLVDINYGPTAKPWGEIEGPNQISIFEVAQKLGYGKSDLASMSDGDYYKQFGITKKQLRDMTFEKFKRNQNE